MLAPLVLAFMTVAVNSPDACVRKFVDAVNSWDVRKMAALIDSPDEAAIRKLSTSGDTPNIVGVMRGRTIALQILKTSQIYDRAAVSVILRIGMKGKKPYPHRGIVSLIRLHGAWRLKTSEAAQSELDKDAAFVEKRQVWSMKPGTDGPLDPVRDLASACFVSASAGKLHLPSPSEIDALRPYSDRKDYWANGHWKGAKCSVNPYLLGHKLFDTDVANTVLVYEGSNQKLAFTHQGRAVVAFVDAHSEFVTPNQAKSLRWKPWP